MIFTLLLLDLKLQAPTLYLSGGQSSLESKTIGLIFWQKKQEKKNLSFKTYHTAPAFVSDAYVTNLLNASFQHL